MNIGGLFSIHESISDGQRKQMADQIDEYGLYDFWADYKHYLMAVCSLPCEEAFEHYTDAAISYHRIRYR